MNRGEIALGWLRSGRWGRPERKAPQPGAHHAVSGRVAVFIDFENLVCGVGKAVPDGEQIPALALAWLCRGAYGNASIRRAYADWANPGFGRYRQVLADNGIDLVQVTRSNIAGKNAADIHMVVDAMEVLITHSDVTVFILVTGDSDYSPLVHRLRAFGKHVVGVGSQANTSQRLVSVCSEYTYWSSILTDVASTGRLGSVARDARQQGSVDPTEPDSIAGELPASPPAKRVVPAKKTVPAASMAGTSPAKKAVAPAKVNGSPVAKKTATKAPAAPRVNGDTASIAEAEALLLRAFAQISTSTPSAGHVKNKMVAIDPSFDHKVYGCRTFREFLARFPSRVVAVGRSGGDITVKLVRTTK